MKIIFKNDLPALRAILKDKSRRLKKRSGHFRQNYCIISFKCRIAFWTMKTSNLFSNQHKYQNNIQGSSRLKCPAKTKQKETKISKKKTCSTIAEHFHVVMTSL